MIRVILITLLLAAMVASQLGAEEYLGDRRWVASPDNRHLLTFSGRNQTAPDAFTIQDLRGKTLFSSRDCPALADIIEYEPEHVLWSPDGQVVALAAGYSKNLVTYIFVRSGDAFVHVETPPLAEDYDNPWILPAGWFKGHVLRLKISGPHAGKARDYGYSGDAKLKVSFNPLKCEKISERIK